MRTHTHRALPNRTRTVGFEHCVSDRCNPRAHGGVCHWDYCTCGARRPTNSTGFGREERGEWQSHRGGHLHL